MNKEQTLETSQQAVLYAGKIDVDVEEIFEEIENADECLHTKTIRMIATKGPKKNDFPLDLIIVRFVLETNSTHSHDEKFGELSRGVFIAIDN